MKTEDIRKYVRDRYAGIAKQGGSAAAHRMLRPRPRGGGRSERPDRLYGRGNEIGTPGIQLGLGCGNPTALASLRAGRPFWTWARVRASTASWRQNRSVPAGKSSAST